MSKSLTYAFRNVDKKIEMERTLLLIDDDTDLVAALAEYLPRFNFKVLSAHTPSVGLKMLQDHAVDLVILDVMLPEKDGIQVCKEIRQRSRVPIIMLTARGDMTDRIVGLEVGADDYLPKPFEPRELVARLEAVLRRSRSPEPLGNLIFRDLEINLQEQWVSLGGKRIGLTAMEFEILVLLASKPGEIISREQIRDHLRGESYDSLSRTIDVTLSRLRSKLKDDPKQPRFIKTVWGSGYVFMGAADGKAA